MKPIFILVENDPWNMVIGSDSPTFALYDDGSVIFLERSGDGARYLHVNLDAEDIRGLAEQLCPKDKANYQPRYDLSNWTDQPFNMFYFEGTIIRVYGDLRQPPDEPDEADGGDGFLEELEEEEKKQWQLFPDELLGIFQLASEYHHDRAKPWMPEYVELIFWPYENAPDESITWPEAWPDLDDPKTRKAENNTHHVYLSSHFYNDFMEFLRTREPRGAIKINDQKMTVSHRFPFPREKLWMTR